MKTNQPTAASVNPSVLIPASPVLLECIQLLKSVSDKLIDWAENNPQIAEECLVDGIDGIVDPMNDISSKISEVMRYEMIDNIYFGLKAN